MRTLNATDVIVLVSMFAPFLAGGGLYWLIRTLSPKRRRLNRLFKELSTRSWSEFIEVLYKMGVIREESNGNRIRYNFFPLLRLKHKLFAETIGSLFNESTRSGDFDRSKEIARAVVSVLGTKESKLKRFAKAAGPRHKLVTCIQSELLLAAKQEVEFRKQEIAREVQKQRDQSFALLREKTLSSYQ